MQICSTHYQSDLVILNKALLPWVFIITNNFFVFDEGLSLDFGLLHVYGGELDPRLQGRTFYRCVELDKYYLPWKICSISVSNKVSGIRNRVNNDLKNSPIRKIRWLFSSAFLRVLYLCENLFYFFKPLLLLFIQPG